METHPKNKACRALGKMLTSGFLIIGLATALSAQENLPERSPGYHGTSRGVQSKIVAVTDSKVTLRFTFDNGVWFEVTQLEGETISLEKDGAKIGFVASVGEDGVSLTAYDMLGVKDQERNLSEGNSLLSKFKVSRKAPQSLWPSLGLKIELLNIVKDWKSEGLVNHSPPYKTSSLDPGGLCCVTCSGIKMCACSVTAPCGECCVGVCCG
jgi:hypothetical protein